MHNGHLWAWVVRANGRVQNERLDILDRSTRVVISRFKNSQHIDIGKNPETGNFLKMLNPARRINGFGHLIEFVMMMMMMMLCGMLIDFLH